MSPSVGDIVEVSHLRCATEPPQALLVHTTHSRALLPRAQAARLERKGVAHPFPLPARQCRRRSAGHGRAATDHAATACRTEPARRNLHSVLTCQPGQAAAKHGGRGRHRFGAGEGLRGRFEPSRRRSSAASVGRRRRTAACHGSEESRRPCTAHTVNGQRRRCIMRTNHNKRTTTTTTTTNNSERTTRGGLRTVAVPSALRAAASSSRRRARRRGRRHVDCLGLAAPASHGCCQP